MTEYLSKEKIEELKKHLQELKTTRRFEVADKLKRAKEHGDLSENFEYAQAKDDQERLEREIFDLENLIKNAKIITKSRNKNIVSVGMTVTLKQDGKTISSYTIVGSQESDPVNKKISNVSPIGKALIGKKIGDKVKVKTPKGTEIDFEILKID
ncbi:transcription elongation factor GreA [Candidatus Wolfebacteria bacterium GWA1_42_9]|uniref:Transcription elongation factor GreA n=1 Tax=Candidatus Wolfebacteria bacterium GWA1_42_9 TaxID=1802553 RepID=A0A1F8DLF0_9BACT|nr:MAG: Transcription elongation factor GreA [Parcubacteria group bacterium GW2011_GWB1_43_8b]OGM89453.1 MAG: transcription elongation factor GreA [Candidatus Wolfebacteria bacterium GWA1_42_9]